MQTRPAAPIPAVDWWAIDSWSRTCELGYVPHGEGTTKHHFGTKDEGPVSNTLEYAFDDWNVAQMAQALGKQEDYEHFTKRAYNYKNVFDASTGYVRPRLATGEWADAKSKYGDQMRHDSWDGMGFIEGNAWQYTWFVPHDVGGLVELMGKDEFNRRLEEGFVKSSKTQLQRHGRPVRPLPDQSRQSTQHAGSVSFQLLGPALEDAALGAGTDGQVLRRRSGRRLARR